MQTNTLHRSNYRIIYTCTFIFILHKYAALTQTNVFVDLTHFVSLELDPLQGLEYVAVVADGGLGVTGQLSYLLTAYRHHNISRERRVNLYRLK